LHATGVAPQRQAKCKDKGSGTKYIH